MGLPAARVAKYGRQDLKKSVKMRTVYFLWINTEDKKMFNVKCRMHAPAPADGKGISKALFEFTIQHLNGDVLEFSSLSESNRMALTDQAIAVAASEN